jgi:hypothetical protein
MWFNHLQGFFVSLQAALTRLEISSAMFLASKLSEDAGSTHEPKEFS